jgi:hypothetical protein
MENKKAKSLVGKRFLGRVIHQDDPSVIKTRTPHDTYNNGQYLVNIPELQYQTQHQDQKESAIWCFNDVQMWRIGFSDARRPKEDNGPFGSGYYGEYYPLHPRTLVVVEFYSENLLDAHITQILSHQNDNNCVPFNFDMIDKDDVYQFYRTPRWDNLYCLFEETKSLPYNSIHNYFNIENKSSSPINDQFGGTDNNTLPLSAIRTKIIINEPDYGEGNVDVHNGGIHLATHK